jgi:hypothetical protein
MARNELKAKIRLEGDAKSADAAIKKTESGFKRLGASIKRNALAITASLAAITAAFKLIQSSSEQAGQARAFERNLERQGIAADEFLAKLQLLSDGQIATADIILASNRALALGIQADDLPGLLTTAANAAVELGISTTQAFNDITTGVGRASPLILDNLGIVVDAERVYSDFADSIGVTKEELTKQQRTIALTKAVTDQATDATTKFSEKQDEMTRAINKGSAALTNLKNASGTVLSGLVQMTAGGVTVSVIAFSLLAEVLIKVTRGFVAVLRVIPGVSGALTGTADAIKKLDDDIDTFQQKSAQFALDLSKGGIAAVQMGLGIEGAGEKADASAAPLGRAGDAAKAAGDEAGSAKDEFDDLGESLNDVGSEADGAGGAFTQLGRNARDAVAGVNALTQAQRDLAASIAAAQAASTAFDPTRSPTSTLSGAQKPLFPGLGGGGGGTFTVVGKNIKQLPNGRIVVA